MSKPARTKLRFKAKTVIIFAQSLGVKLKDSEDLNLYAYFRPLLFLHEEIDSLLNEDGSSEFLGYYFRAFHEPLNQNCISEKAHPHP